MATGRVKMRRRRLTIRGALLFDFVFGF